MSDKLWATPKGTDGERGGRGDLLAMARGYQMAHNGTLLNDSSQLTLFAEAFPVSRTVSLVDVPAPTTSVTCGPTSLDSFASLNPDGSWRKTSQGYCQVLLVGSLDPFSETCPRAGMTRSGTAYRRPPLAPLTDAIASGWLPTPSAESYGTNHGGSAGRVGPIRPSLETMARQNLWPTPTAQDASNNAGSSQFGPGSLPLNAAIGGALNPTWIEWLMGYPLEWTVCAAWATVSSRRSRDGSHRRSPAAHREEW